MSEIRNVTHIDNVRLSDDGSSVIILDQSRLPMHTEYIEINKPAEMYDAIFHHNFSSYDEEVDVGQLRITAASRTHIRQCLDVLEVCQIN